MGYIFVSLCASIEEFKKGLKVKRQNNQFKSTVTELV